MRVSFNYKESKNFRVPKILLFYCFHKKIRVDRYNQQIPHLAFLPPTHSVRGVTFSVILYKTIYSSAWSSIYLSVCLYIYLSICLFVCLCFFLFSFAVLLWTVCSCWEYILKTYSVFFWLAVYPNKLKYWTQCAA